MTAAPYLLGRRGPGAYVPIATGGGGTGTGIGDGGSVEPPVVTTNAAGDVTVKGKIKAGSFGKIIVPLASVAAGRQYTFRYTPHFAQLAQQGKLAMVGIGFKADNDFHIVGLRGDGSTGLHKYKVYGTPPNGWNKQTGHTESDGGAAANGTQAGPNYIRIVISADGATYKFQTSPDGVTWTDEFTGAVPSPFSNVSGVVNFGLALWFNNADAGVYSITVDQFADAAAPVTDPYFSSVVLLLGFDGTNGATATSDESSKGHVFTFGGNAQLDTSSAAFGSASLILDASGDYITTSNSADFRLAPSGNNTDQYTIELWYAPHGNVGGGSWLLGFGTIGEYCWDLDHVQSGGVGTCNLAFDWSSNGSARQALTSSGLTITLDTWHYVAISKNASGKIRMWFDGSLVASTTPADSSMAATTQPFEIGRFIGTTNTNTRIDEVRITKGVCRYDTDSSITVPTAAFPRA